MLSWHINLGPGHSRWQLGNFRLIYRKIECQVIFFNNIISTKEYKRITVALIHIYMHIPGPFKVAAR